MDKDKARKEVGTKMGIRPIIPIVIFSSAIIVLRENGNADSVSPPPPPPLSPSAAPPAVEASNIVAPITFTNALQQVEDAADAQLRYLVAEDDGSDCNEYGVYFPGKGSPPNRAAHVTASGDTISLRARLTYRGKFHLPNAKPFCGPSVNCGYGEPAREMDVGFDVKLGISADWHLTATPAPVVQPLNQCNVSILNRDQTGRAADRANSYLTNIKDQIEAQVSSRTDFKPTATRAWTRLQQPISLGNNLWLVIGPDSIKLSSISSSGRDLAVTLGIQAHPVLRASTQMPAVSPSPLPPLGSVPQSGTGAFHIALDGILTYSEATNIANQLLKDRLYPFPGGRKIRIENVRVYASGPIMVIQLEVSGDVTGSLYLQGMPTYQSQTPDGQTDVLTVSSLDYTVATRNALSANDSWLLQSSFRNDIQSAASFPLGGKISELRAAANKGMNHDFGSGVSTNGSITALRPVGVYTDSARFLIRVVGDGTVRAEVSLSAVKSFEWTYNFNPEPGKRVWNQTEGSGSWTEQYSSGHTNRFSFSSRQKINACTGTVVDREDIPGMQVFIPDAGCGLMWLRFRQSAGDWQWMGEMTNVTVW